MTCFAQNSRIVFDLGMNNGDDTAYYLARGFKVVAVEANPALCSKAAARFATEIHDGQLTIFNRAIWETSGIKTFYVNTENDHWSSLELGWAGRDNSDYKEISVRCVTLTELFDEFSSPYYLKIDVEGVDHIVLAQLAAVEALPMFVSVEDCRFGFSYMETLAACGYDGFKLLDQSTVPNLCDPRIGYRFPVGSSGPLGEDIEGRWLSYSEIVDAYACTVRDRAGARLAPRSQWWDIHCTRLSSG